MAKLKATPKNYADALAVLAGRTSVRLGNNTHLLAINERVYSAGHITEERITVAVNLHDTNIVKFYEDGRITLHTGGWQTVTTKDRINEFISGRVYQKKHAWFYVGHNVEGAIDWDNPIVFSEGLNVGQEAQ